MNNLGRSDTKKNLLGNFATGSIAIAVALSQQIIAVPLFLHAWDMSTYALWLVLMAFPGYLQLTDGGFGVVAINRMSMYVADHREQTANDVFRTAFVILMACNALLVGFTALLPQLFPIARWSALQRLDGDVGPALIFVAIYSGAYMFHGLFVGVLRATGRNPLVDLINASLSLLELALIAALLFVQTQLLQLLAAVTLLRVALVAFTYLYVFTSQKRISLALGRWRFTEWTAMKSLGLAYLGFPLGTALVNQGMVLLTATLLGPAPVIQLNIIRTFANTAFSSVTGLVVRAFGPEISRHIGAHDHHRAAVLSRLALTLGGWGVGLSALALGLLHVPLMHLWLRDRIDINSTLVCLFLLRVFFQSLWALCNTVLSYTNEHRRFATHFAISSTLSLIAILVLIPNFGLSVIPLIMMTTDIYLVTLGVRESCRVTLDTPSQLLRDMLLMSSFRRVIKSFWMARGRSHSANGIND